MKKLVGEIEADEWETIACREGTKGKSVREAAQEKSVDLEKRDGGNRSSGIIDQPQNRPK